MADRDKDGDLDPLRDGDKDLDGTVDSVPDLDPLRDRDTGLPLRDRVMDAEGEEDSEMLRVPLGLREGDGDAVKDRVIDPVRVRVAVRDRERVAAAPTSTRSGV